MWISHYQLLWSCQSCLWYKEKEWNKRKNETFSRKHMSLCIPASFVACHGNSFSCTPLKMLFLFLSQDWFMYSKPTYIVIENNAWDMHFLLYQHQRRISYQEVKNKQQTWFNPTHWCKEQAFVINHFLVILLQRLIF